MMYTAMLTSGYRAENLLIIAQVRMTLYPSPIQILILKNLLLFPLNLIKLNHVTIIISNLIKDVDITNIFKKGN